MWKRQMIIDWEVYEWGAELQQRNYENGGDSALKFARRRAVCFLLKPNKKHRENLQVEETNNTRKAAR